MRTLAQNKKKNADGAGAITGLERAPALGVFKGHAGFSQFRVCCDYAANCSALRAVLAAIRTEEPGDRIQDFRGMDRLGKNLKFVALPSGLLQQAFDGRLSGHQQDATVWKTLLQRHCKVDPVHTWEHDIEDRESRRPSREAAQRRLRRVGDARIVAT